MKTSGWRAEARATDSSWGPRWENSSRASCSPATASASPPSCAWGPVPFRKQVRFPPKRRFRLRVKLVFIRKTQPERTGVPVNRNTNSWRRGAQRLAIALLRARCLSRCKRLEYVSTRPLDDAGFTYSVIQEIRGLDINNAEVAELVKAKNAGISEQACVDLVKGVRGRKQRF